MTELVSASVMFIVIASSLYQFVLTSKVQKIEEKLNKELKYEKDC